MTDFITQQIHYKIPKIYNYGLENYPIQGISWQTSINEINIIKNDIDRLYINYANLSNIIYNELEITFTDNVFNYNTDLKLIRFTNLKKYMLKLCKNNIQILCKKINIWLKIKIDNLQYEFNDGDFASNIFFVNGRYTFDPVAQTNLRPYIGGGLGYVEEIDVDLKSGGVERSYSKNSEMAYQFMAGITYPLTEKIDLDAGLRYVRVDNIKLKRESGSGELRNVDYDPLSLAVGLSYKF